MLLAALILIGLAGRMHPRLLEMREKHGLVQGPVLENLPPLEAFIVVAIGGVRGIVADILWLRASKLQEEGKYFELVQLADWITKLEPRFAQVWAFHAWNLSYNISVMLSDSKDRWRWVQHGFE